jgi:RNA polymerase sigma-70 factor, ECF subfamily
MTDLIASMADARERFLELVSGVRPELHRYCTRMTGSVFDGEDVVQETLAKACYALAQMEAPPALRPWLFRIAHNTALDFVRRYEHRHVHASENLDEVSEVSELPPDGERVEAALTVFSALPPLQRSALVLKDVLGLSLEETADTMQTSVAAVKAALLRARANVTRASTDARPVEIADIARLRHYADLFNARDFDGLRALFGEETRLEVVSRVERRGPSAAEYFTRYPDIAAREALRAEVGWVHGMAVIAIFRPAASAEPAYFVRLRYRDDAHIVGVRDYRYVPYIARDAGFTA